ncbi:phospholipid scramblase-related protein [Spirillospora sp. CA-294931]|uniref:phospholipid scramblase-related protein n=1 Tax=Spirillospora sp. CA-294931 TaxID=3240042 RepID=UPI003D8F4779
MTELFNSPVLRIEQPRKMIQTQTRYDFLDEQGNLLAVATDVETLTRREAVRAVLPQGTSGAHILVLRDADELPLLVMRRLDNWNTAVSRPAPEGEEIDDGELIGTIRGISTRRQFALLGPDEQELGKAVGDLRLRNFSVSDAKGRRAAQISKKWAGLRAEVFTNADRYSVEITGKVDESLRILAIVMAVVLDLTAYESKDLV